jgi:hypothetical protein
MIDDCKYQETSSFYYIVLDAKFAMMTSDAIDNAKQQQNLKS